MKISNITYQNFKGLRKISDNGFFYLHLSEDYVIHVLNGENGVGKSTILSTSNPFIFPNGYSSKSTEGFVDYPAKKVVEFSVNQSQYKSVIEYVKKGVTKAKIFSLIDNEWVIAEGFQSGKGKTYEDELSLILGVSQKEISMVNYIGQNTNAIIEANPKDRSALIEPLISGIENHGLIFDHYKDQEVSQKDIISLNQGELNAVNKQIESFIGVDFDKCSDQALFMQKSRVKGIDENITSVISKGKALRVKLEKTLKSEAEFKLLSMQIDAITKSDDLADFPQPIENNGSPRLIKDIEKEILSGETANQVVDKKEKSIRDDINRSLVKKNTFSSFVISINDKRNALGVGADIVAELDQVNSKIEKLEKTVKEWEKNELLCQQNTAIDKNIINLENLFKDTKHNEEKTNLKIVEVRELIRLNTGGRNDVEEFITTIIDFFNLNTDDNFGFEDKLKSESIRIFGIDLTISSEVRDEFLENLNLTLSELEKNNQNLLFNANNRLKISHERSSKNKTLILTSDNESSKLNNLRDRKSQLLDIISVKDKYVSNSRYLLEVDELLVGLNNKIENLKKIDITDLYKEKDFCRNFAKIESVNLSRLEYLKLKDSLGDFTKLSEDSKSLSASLQAVEQEFQTLNDKKTKLEEDLSVMKINNGKLLDLSNLEKIKKNLKETLDESKVTLKVFNSMKLYCKNIKETLVSQFMIEITNSANSFLANDDYSSIEMSLSIEQKGQRFLIFASQPGSDKQEINTLSGAEMSTVNRALATAISFHNKDSNYGLYCYDEADGSLSQSNKRSFIDNIKHISENDMVEQLLIISHDNEVVSQLKSNIISLSRG